MFRHLDLSRTFSAKYSSNKRLAVDREQYFSDQSYLAKPVISTSFCRSFSVNEQSLGYLAIKPMFVCQTFDNVENHSAILFTVLLEKLYYSHLPTDSIHRKRTKSLVCNARNKRK